MAERHDLKSWLENKGKSAAEFARNIPCSESYLSRILAGKQEPSLRMAARMSGLTGFEVPIGAFIRDLTSGTENVSRETSTGSIT